MYILDLSDDEWNLFIEKKSGDFILIESSDLNYMCDKMASQHLPNPGLITGLSCPVSKPDPEAV